MKAIKRFFAQSIKDLLLTAEGGLSLPKLSALVASSAATYKFIVAEINDPLVWLVYLGVVGGHVVAGKLLEVWNKPKAEGGE
jgi:hypothetical protein